MDEVEVVDDSATPRGVVATSGAVSPEAREQGFTREPAVVHTAEMTEPTKAVGAKDVSERADVAPAADVCVGNLPVGGVADVKNGFEATDGEGQASDVTGERGPRLRSVEEGREDRCLEDAGLGLH